jgi:uncharacterized protein (DUF2235 family)
MPRNLIVCSDGTSNSKRTKTNVWRFHHALKPLYGKDCFYDRGVGSFAADITGKAFGTGVDQNLRECYEFLVRRWEPGDRIFLFGFSRGAFTVRSLANFIDLVGLVAPTKKKVSVRNRKGPGRIRKSLQKINVQRAYDLYRLSRKQVFEREITKARDEIGLRECPVYCIGVWDTVGAIGLPARRNDPKAHLKHRHHRTDLSPTVRYAFQALALDDERQVFWPDRFDAPGRPDQTVEEVWFAGMHSDVGGGYEKEKRMSNVALRWMASKMPATLGISRSTFPVQEADSKGPMHDSRTGAAKAYRRRVRRPRPGAKAHASVLDRIAGPLVAPSETREPRGVYRPRALVQKSDTRNASAFRPQWDSRPDFGLGEHFEIVDRNYRD